MHTNHFTKLRQRRAGGRDVHTTSYPGSTNKVEPLLLYSGAKAPGCTQETWCRKDYYESVAPIREIIQSPNDLLL